MPLSESAEIRITCDRSHNLPVTQSLYTQPRALIYLEITRDEELNPMNFPVMTATTVLTLFLIIFPEAHGEPYEVFEYYKQEEKMDSGI